jgi:hypothetical protein
MKESCEISSRPKTFKSLIRSKYFWKPAIGVLLGAVVGYLYFYFIGCQSGSCPITSSATGSIIMGALLGLFITNSPCSKGTC